MNEVKDAAFAPLEMGGGVKKMWAFRLDENDKRKLRECAEHTGIGYSELVRQLISVYHEQHVKPCLVVQEKVAAVAKRRTSPRTSPRV